APAPAGALALPPRPGRPPRAGRRRRAALPRGGAVDARRLPRRRRLLRHQRLPDHDAPARGAPPHGWDRGAPLLRPAGPPPPPRALPAPGHHLSRRGRVLPGRGGQAAPAGHLGADVLDQLVPHRRGRLVLPAAGATAAPAPPLVAGRRGAV